MQFTPFPKIPRLSRDCIISEKIDGTNVSIFIADINDPDITIDPTSRFIVARRESLILLTGSRTRWITPDDDNYNFSKWARDNQEDLFNLGPGHHFGEWWGRGIQSGYGLDHRRFSLFNSTRWGYSGPDAKVFGCHVVPVLYQGLFSTNAVEACIEKLREVGSFAVPGFTKPEGVVVYHVAGNYLFKKTLEKDERPKGVING